VPLVLPLEATPSAALCPEEKMLAPYEKKSEKFERQERKSGASGRLMPDEQNMRYLPLKFKKGGSASARADGCAIRGKTRA